MEKVHRFWSNRKFGWARRVVKVYVDETAYRVEFIEGAEDRAKSQDWSFDNEADALAKAEGLRAGDPEYHEIKPSLF